VSDCATAKRHECPTMTGLRFRKLGDHPNSCIFCNFFETGQTLFLFRARSRRAPGDYAQHASYIPSPIMPAIRHASKRKPPPEGFSDIENDLLIFSNKMKDAQNKPSPSGPKHQAQWEIFQISHQRSRYVYDLYYEKEAISKQLYDWLLKNGYADAMLIAKWKKQGYEKVRSTSRDTCRAGADR
jgi:hypothetical protein